MRNALKMLLTVILMQVLSCASLLGPSGSINEQINYWLDKKEYGNALAIVDNLHEHPAPEIANIQPLEDKVINQASQYEQQVISAANNAAAKDDWRSALDLYQEALARLPDSIKLKEGQQLLIQRQEASLAKLQLEQLISQAESMQKELFFSEKFAATDPKDWFTRHKFNNKIDDANKLANALAEFGRRGLAEGDLELAKRTLPLAMKLSSAPDIKTANTRLQELLKEDAKRVLTKQQHDTAPEQLTKHQEQQKPSPKRVIKKPATAAEQNQFIDTQILNAFKKALITDDNLDKPDEQERPDRFAEALRLKQELEKSNIDTSEFQELNKKLENKISAQVRKLTDAGTQKYSRQEYEEAMQKWQQAHALDPQNEKLKAHIERAEKVLEKLKSLKQKKRPASTVEK